jgi:superfamily I DNA/RNA helicase
MPSFTPTAQQTAAVDAAKSGGNLVITACAGSGKTSTLELIADALAPAKGCYIAYNKAIATDAAKKFPSNVECRTAHSYAYRAAGFRYKGRLNAGRMTGRQMAAVLEVDRSYPLGDDRELSQARVASLIMATVAKWCHSDDDRILVEHAAAVVYNVPGAEMVSYDLSNYLAAEAQRAWDSDLKHESGRLPFSHDMYVKVWALSKPKLPGKFVLYDEAQDADPCIAGVVLAQKDMQLIAVGDESQAIYGWRGATDAMKTWPAQHRVKLSQSFRFGQAVADEANVFLEALRADLRVEGYGAIPSTVGPVAEPDAVISRTNAALVSYALSLPSDKRFAIVGGTQAIQKMAEAAHDLMSGKRASWHPDFGPFKNWGDVLDYVENDSGGADLRSMVKIIEEYGVATILEVCSRSVSEERADVVLTTAHKSKGREWDRVVIADDFMPSEDSEMDSLNKAEAMLMYVAVTRAKLALDCSALDWAKGMEVA